MLCGKIVLKSNISKLTMVTMDLSLSVLHGTRPAPTGGGNSFFLGLHKFDFQGLRWERWCRWSQDQVQIKTSFLVLGRLGPGPQIPGQLGSRPDSWMAQLSRAQLNLWLWNGFLENWSRTVGSWDPVCLEPSAQGKTQISEYEKGLSLS